MLRTIIATLLVLPVSLPATAQVVEAADMMNAVQKAPGAPASTDLGKPIGGVGIVVKKNPGGSSERTTTGCDGSFSFSGRPQGAHTLTIEGHAPIPVSVGRDGKLSGVVKRDVVSVTNARGTTLVKWYGNNDQARNVRGNAAGTFRAAQLSAPARDDQECLQGDCTAAQPACDSQL
jgi:hypothetical protein